MRQFETGATRDTDEGKLAYSGFLNPLVLKRFAEYMHKHRFQKDGSVREPDNWQKGMDLAVYMDSLLRHVMDVWLHHQKYPGEATEPIQDSLCGVLFNAMGYMLELEKEVEPGGWTMVKKGTLGDRAGKIYGLKIQDQRGLNNDYTTIGGYR